MLASEGFNEARVMAIARKLWHYILSGFSSFLNRITMTMTTVSETWKQCSTWRGSWRETTLRWQRRLFWWGWVNLSTSKSDLTWHDIIEIHLFFQALRDMNLPQIIKDRWRAPLPSAPRGPDLFPSLELPVYVGIRWSPSRISVSVFKGTTLQSASESELEKANLQQHEFFISKIFQFYDSRLTRSMTHWRSIGREIGWSAWKVGR